MSDQELLALSHLDCYVGGTGEAFAAFAGEVLDIEVAIEAFGPTANDRMMSKELASWA